ncbi:MAG: DUF503 domain-containing protein [Novibacillus thermophilus]|jgi:uncharacterized protein YlxP (DUF503 family)|uniref:DUF503 domain-containing protein n=1 Tax=Novibacillus thermophilus TaxID=1471761 RepID=A0A1U9K9V3_9BACL|nr:DUF503 domain-containing protein [Novibacillus thermophilus]AQS56849.1 hypothetical protein B0W44_14950 [Novibacillus thermophilus]
MIIGTMTCHCRVPASTSLKDKRRVIKSVITRIKNRYNVSIAEVDMQDHQQLATIGMGVVANTKKQVERELNFALKVLDGEHELEVLSVDHWVG